uniref:peptidylprolyl isomerase n=1 Tax=Ornithorhynchus anatinus TaxID=9258 RepID=A0A6I8NK61_ORNAN
MKLLLWNSLLSLLVASVNGALIPEPEVKIEVLQKPFICQRKTKGGDMMLVHYEGYLEKDGSLFHSTHKHNNGQPIWFTLGILEALKGWDRGLKGMCVGEKRKLTIPPALGYGKEGKAFWYPVCMHPLERHQPFGGINACYFLCLYSSFPGLVKFLLKAH